MKENKIPIWLVLSAICFGGAIGLPSYYRLHPGENLSLILVITIILFCLSGVFGKLHKKKSTSDEYYNL